MKPFPSSKNAVWKNSGTSLAGEIPVYSGGEDGLVGLVLDPDFSDNGWIYLYYSPIAISLQLH